MAEFQEVMRQWKRMCDKYFDGKNWVCSKTCPMYVFEVCSKPTVKYPVPLEIGQDLAHEIDCVIMSWAAEHPEPVYPTFREWLISIGVIGQMSTHSVIADKLDMTSIPANIAQKLGIEPKE